MISEADKKQLRSFGFLVGGAFLFFGLWPVVWRGEALRLWAVIPAALLLPLGLIAPSLLAPIHKGWMVIGHVLGWINTRLILGVVFYGLIMPMGLVMRLFGWDFMRRAFLRESSTYRVIKERDYPYETSVLAT